MKVVWFKRDLRLSDHVPLVKAIDSEEPVLGVYIVEDIRIEQDDVSQLHIAWDIANARGNYPSSFNRLVVPFKLSVV